MNVAALNDADVPAASVLNVDGAALNDVDVPVAAAAAASALNVDGVHSDSWFDEAP